VTAIVARFFAFVPSGVLDAGYVTGTGADTQVALGAFFCFRDRDEHRHRRWLMYRTGLVPRTMAMLGLIGVPLAFASGVAVLFDAAEPGSSLQEILTILEIL
jgi:hypothetical protein